MTSTLIRLGLILMTVLSPLLALESVSFIVGPNSIKYGAMGEVKPDVRDVTVTAEGDWWITDPGAKCIAKDNSDLQISQPMPQDPRCPKDKMPKAVKWEITASHSNHIMRLQIDGTLHYCDGNGGQPPPFASHILHADLDVDSDNTNTSSYTGRAPDSPADSSAPDPKEDAIEDDSDKPGVVVLVNRGWDQTTAPGIDFDALAAAQKTQDVDRLDTTMVKLADPHLVKARVVIKGMKDKGTLTLKAPAQVRIYGDDGKLFTTGERANGEHWFYLEGVTASAALGDVRIVMEVTAPDAIGSSKDTIRCTVVDIAVDGLAEPAKGDTWGAASKRFAYAGADKTAGILTVMPRMTLKPALPIALASQLLNESNCTLSVAAIDDSHGGGAAGQRVALKWKKARTTTEAGIVWGDKTQYTVGTGIVSVFARFTGLPSNNSDFGDKWFQVSVMGVPYQKLPWRAFFNAKIDSHPTTKGDSANAIDSENWYYYWSQQRKGDTVSVCAYSYDGSSPLISYLRVPPVADALGFVPLSNAYVALCGPAVYDNGKRRKKMSSSGKGGIPAVMNLKYTDVQSGQKVTSEIRAAFVLQGSTDIVNATWAHESTHWMAHNAATQPQPGQPPKPPLKDDDGDGVPNVWELQLGMNPYSKTSFKNFTGSGGGDQEAYAWLGTCLSDAAATKKLDLEVNGVAVVPQYNGSLAPKSNETTDWSIDGVMWEKSP